MLILTRRRDERIIIDGGIEICVVEIRGDKVRMGITAPTGVNIAREELLKNKQPDITPVPET